MTGPEHYRIAEALLENLHSVSPGVVPMVLAEAQVRATLALTAVTAHHMVATSGDDREEWSKAIHGPAAPTPEES